VVRLRGPGPTLFPLTALFVALAGVGVHLGQLYVVLTREVLRGVPIASEALYQLPKASHVSVRLAREAVERIVVDLEGGVLRGLLVDRAETILRVAAILELGELSYELREVYLGFERLVDAARAWCELH
jgi:hypothetical protein